MNWNFIRINIMLSKNRSNQPKKFSLQNNAKNLEFFIFFKKRLRKDFLLDGSRFLYSWTLQKCKKTHSNIILVSNLMWDSSAMFVNHKRLKMRIVHEHSWIMNIMNSIANGLKSQLQIFQPKKKIDPSEIFVQGY